MASFDFNEIAPLQKSGRWLEANARASAARGGPRCEFAHDLNIVALASDGRMAAERSRERFEESPGSTETR